MRFSPVIGNHGAPSREGVVKVRDSCDVPRVASQGACEEGANVVDKVGDDQFHEFL